MARVWLYVRTSGDEADTGQDVRAQLAGLRVRVEGLGHVVVGESLDDGVSGLVPWSERDGLRRAINAALPRGVDGAFSTRNPDAPGVTREADAVAVVEASRLSRQDPAEALTVFNDHTAKGVRFLCLKEGHFTTLGGAFEIEDDSLYLLRFFTFWQAWSERRRLVARTQSAMDDLKSKLRNTKSGKPVGRPKKDLAPAEGTFVREAQAAGKSPAWIAHELSKRRGAFETPDPALRRERMVSRTQVRRFLGPISADPAGVAA